MQSQTRLAELFITYLFGSTQLHITQCSRLNYFGCYLIGSGRLPELHSALAPDVDPQCGQELPMCCNKCEIHSHGMGPSREASCRKST